VYTSFTQLNEYTLGDWLSAPFIGVANYVNALTESNILGASALESVGVSVAFSLLSTALITPIGIAAALAVNRPFRGRAFVRAFLLIPYALPVFVTGVLWRFMFMNGWGLVDLVLSRLHLASINTYWLLGPNSFWALVIADCWGAWPFVYLMVLAGLQGIPQELYEAAYIDGASVPKALWTITLPLLRPVLGLALLLSTLNHFNNFTLPFVMFGTPPPSQADVLPLNVYVTSFETLNFGLGAAMSLLTLVIMVIPAFFYIRALHLGEVDT
jgi:multiple sugar transport system permease protein